MNRGWQTDSAPETGTFAKARAEERLRTTALRDRAVRIVAHQSANADDCRSLLAMLGLDEELGKPATTRPVPERRFNGQYGRRIG